MSKLTMRALLTALSAVAVACSPEQLSLFDPVEPTQAPAEEEWTEPVVERAHEVEVRVEGRVAVLTVWRELEWVAGDTGILNVEVELPRDGALTGLRLGGEGEWTEGVLFDEDCAVAEFNRGVTGPRASRALLSHLNEHAAELDIALAERNLPLWVGYQLRAPLQLRNGEWTLDYEPGEATPAFRFLSLPAGAPAIRLRKEEDEPALETPKWRLILAPAELPGLEARYGRFSLSEDAALWRFELSAPTTLRPEPSAISVVFALDASSSQGAEGIAQQLALIRSYTAAAPSAQLEIVVFRRKAHRLFGRWLPASKLEGELSTLGPAALAPGNGSNLDDAAALAAEIARSGEGERRVVLFSDNRLRAGFQVDATAATLEDLGPSSVVHVALLGPPTRNEIGSTRLLDHPLSPLARDGAVIEFGGLDEDAPRSAEELVRPLRVDGLRYEFAGFTQDTIDAPTQLDRGEAIVAMGVAPEVPSAVTVRGWVWGQEWVKRIDTEPQLSRDLPFFAVHGGEALDLTSTQIDLLASKTGAVAPGYAMVAVGASPSTSPPDSLAMSFRDGFGSTGCGGVRTVIVPRKPRANVEPLVRAAAQRAVQHCPQPQRNVRIELTGREVVDVSVDAEDSDCVREALWSLELGIELDGYDGEISLSL